MIPNLNKTQKIFKQNWKHIIPTNHAHDFLSVQISIKMVLFLVLKYSQIIKHKHTDFEQK